MIDSINMILSIITINYNNAQGLKKTLDSVSVQTCKELEHVIIDGGSTDGSKEVIKEYANNASILIEISDLDKAINSYLKVKKYDNE